MSHVILPPSTKAALVIPFADRDGDKVPDASVMVFEATPDDAKGSTPARLRFETGPINAPVQLAEKAVDMAIGVAPLDPIAKAAAKVAATVFFTGLRGVLGAASK